MNPLERYQACLHFEPMDRPPLHEWGPWESTVRRWMKETGKDRSSVLAWQEEKDPFKLLVPDFSMHPAFDESVITEDESTITKLNSMGLIYREFKENPETSMPEFLDWPVKTPEDWQRIKERFNPDSPERWGEQWQNRLKACAINDVPVRLYGIVAGYYGGPSLFGFVRMLMGDERALYAFYDEPEMVHDMMETITDFSIAMIRRCLEDAKVVDVQFWEDMCYKNGPLISPSLFEEFMVPRYQRITTMIRDTGVNTIFVDSDGDVKELIPLWLKSGINGVFPMEQAAGNDVSEYRSEYGSSLVMTGGIDKRCLANGRKAIDAELELRIPLAFEGGYIPTLDHAIPPDVSYDNFMYYWEKKKELLGIKI